MSLAVAAVTGAAPAASATPVVTHTGVLVHNLSDASAEILQRSEAACRDWFQRAGIRTVWMNSATESVSWEGPALILRGLILRRAPASRRLDVFGSAVVNGKDADFFIYYERVVALSRLAELPVSVVLAGALTHEIGHLLLRSSEHSVAGIMRAEWGQRELNELGQGRLAFTPQQKRQMRSYIELIAARSARDVEKPRRFTR